MENTRSTNPNSEQSQQIGKEFAKLTGITKEIRLMLGSDTPISEDLFFPLVGKFSACINAILQQYFTLNQKDQDHISPLVNYYRQLQNYLVFIIRFPTILLVPHHAEILQTTDFIDKKDDLLQNRYITYSKKEKELLRGSFREKLEDLMDQKKGNKIKGDKTISP